MYYLVGAVISWTIFYYTIKAAIKWAIRETNEEKEISEMKKIASQSKDVTMTPALAELQKKYDRGTITFDQYKTEWDKLLS